MCQQLFSFFRQTMETLPVLGKTEKEGKEADVVHNSPSLQPEETRGQNRKTDRR
jgi:hypothetical protein